jgi:hypothetical protein
METGRKVKKGLGRNMWWRREPRYLLWSYGGSGLGTVVYIPMYLPRK